MILIDGRREEHVSALDRGLAYGDGVFRTMLAQAGRVRHWPLHYRKLTADCGVIGLACPAMSVLAAELDELLRAEPDCVLKIIVTRGVGGRGYTPPSHAKPVRIVASFPVPVHRLSPIEQGVRVRWCSIRLSGQPALAGVKHLNRLENVLARREWQDPGTAEGLMLDAADDVISGTMTNLFLLERDRLITPDLAKCGVAGVQRERLIEIGPRLGLHCAVETVTPNRLMAAQQVLLLNSVIGVWRVRELEERHWVCDDIVFDIARALGREDV